jgi:hypothetical protein
MEGGNDLAMPWGQRTQVEMTIRNFEILRSISGVLSSGISTGENNLDLASPQEPKGPGGE